MIQSSIITLAASSGKRNVTVRSSVCLFVHCVAFF